MPDFSVVKIRPAQPPDAEAIAGVHARSWREGYRDLIGDEPLESIEEGERLAMWQQLLAEPGTASVVVCQLDDVGVIGFASCGPSRHDPEVGEILTCYVDPAHWGRGVGRALLATARRLRRRQGFAQAELQVMAGNERARRFYQADGWDVDGEPQREEVWGVPVDVVRLVRPLPHGDHVTTNRAAWNELARDYARSAECQWAGDPTWGIFAIPDTRVGLLPGDLRGTAVVELGCGTGYVSAWCHRRGASVVGLDNSPAQLATAAEMQRRFGQAFPLVLADAERAPLADASFDLAISEYGAAIWCDPHKWIPEAARLLRPGGRLIFLGSSALLMLCAHDFDDIPATPQLRRPQRGMGRFDWPDTEGIEFHVSHGEMIRILRDAGLEVLDLIELYSGADDTTSYGFVDASWASRWPAEEVWVARRR